MLEPIKDYQNHIVCYADAKTGLLESKYKKQTTKTYLAIGGEFIITKDNIETVIKRISWIAFEVHSYPIAA
ncbi:MULTISPECIES: hypothetical protein [unclassified Clostridium]|uniref:hypothetical protein n=1 Tax=unclassified Clostridium TaxID=2614128 RepID=UPI0032172845